MMTWITSKVTGPVAGAIALALAIACGVQYFELRGARADYATLQTTQRADGQTIGTLRAQFATSQADLNSAVASARACSASVGQAASEAQAVKAAAAVAQLKAVAQGQSYQREIDTLTQRLQNPANQGETCDAALDRLRSGM